MSATSSRWRHNVVQLLLQSAADGHNATVSLMKSTYLRRQRALVLGNKEKEANEHAAKHTTGRGICFRARVRKVDQEIEITEQFQTQLSKTHFSTSI